MPNRIKDFTTLAVLPAADDYGIVDGLANATRRLPALARLSARNALAPAGGVQFTGAGGHAYASLASQPIGADDLSLTACVEVPATNPAQNLGLLALTSSATTAAQPNSIVSHIDTSTTLRVRIYGATTSAYLEASLSLVPWAGKTVFMAITRSAGAATIYINGVAQTATTAEPLPWAGTNYLALTGSANGNNATSPNAASNQITGDVTIIAFFKTLVSTPTNNIDVLMKDDGSTNRQFTAQIGSNNAIFRCSQNGTSFAVSHSRSLSGLATSDIYIRWTRRASDGVMRIAWSIDGSAWNNLGSDGSGATGAMSNGNAALTCGATGTAVTLPTVNLHYARLYNTFEASGAGFVAQCNPSAAANNALTFAAPTTGETWTVNQTVAATPVTVVSEAITWPRSLAATYLTLGLINSTTTMLGRLSRVGFWNCALSPADAVEVFELGGAVPERYKWGISAEMVANGDFASGSGWILDTNWSISGGVLSASAVTVNTTTRRDDVVLVFNKAYLTRFTVFSYSAGSIVFQLGNLAGGSATSVDGTTRTTPGTYSEVLIAPGSNTTGRVAILAKNPTPATFLIDDVSVKRAGAVLFLPLDDGLGFQLRDLGTNRIHALLTNGAAHSLPLHGPASLRATTSTAGDQPVLGSVALPAVALPANAQLLRVRARAQSGTPTVMLGTASGGAQVVAAVGLTTAWKNLTLVPPDGLLGASAVTLWVNSTTAAVIEWHLEWEPLSA